jgi:hypothetical protein
MRPGVTTRTVAVVVPAGTEVVIKYLDAAVNAAAVPLIKGDAGRAGQIASRIWTAAATSPEVVCVLTNGPRPTDRLPPPLSPPSAAVL